MKKYILALFVFSFLSNNAQGIRIIKTPNKAVYVSGDTVLLTADQGNIGKYYPQDLKPIANKPSKYNSFAGFAFGNVFLRGIPFYLPYTTQNTTWDALTSGSNSNQVTTTFPLKCWGHYDSIYFLMNTGYGNSAIDVYIRLNYANGTFDSILLKGGTHLRDWNHHNYTNTCSSSQTFQVWAEDTASTISSGGTHNTKRMDMLRIPVNPSKKLSSITFIDNGSDTQGGQRIFITGMTLLGSLTPTITWYKASNSIGTGNTIQVVVAKGYGVYFAQNQDTCEVYDSIIKGGIAGLSQYLNSDKLNISPNPITDLATIHINYPQKFDEAHLIITSMEGRNVKKIKLHNNMNTLSTKIDANEFENQIYFCSLVIDGSIIETKKLLFIK